MGKQQVLDAIRTDLGWEDWSQGIPITKLIEQLKELQEIGATHIHVCAEYNEVFIDALCMREETDEEYNRRIKRQKELEKNLERFRKEMKEKYKS